MGSRLIATVLPTRPSAVAELLLDPPPGADYLELRLDALDKPDRTTVDELLSLPRSIAVIATCRPRAGLGESDRLALLSAAGEAGADVIDVEDSLIQALPASVPGERLASCHIAHFAPRLEALAQRIASHGSRFAKLAVPAETPRQLVKLLELQEQLPESFAIVPTGRLAEAGRVMIAGRGAALCYGAAGEEHRGHPDQPMVERLHDVFNVGVVGQGTRFLAVVARPVAHSRSPAYHNTVFRGVGADRRMVALDVDRLADVLGLADALRLDGFAITHPFKHDALELATSRMPGAESVGASNTLIRTPNGWQARNTDWKAACDLLPRLLKNWRKEHDDERPRVLLYGSGGAARAIAVALFDEDIELLIWSRHVENARALAEALVSTVRAAAIESTDGVTADLAVNATVVGSPGTEGWPLPVSPANFSPGALAVDLTYGGSDSVFRQATTEACLQTTTGEDFFCLQARRQAELFVAGQLPAGLHDEAARRCGAR
jgi:3-dehydroquinate dehydratase/shikimate dehydrogenase